MFVLETYSQIVTSIRRKLGIQSSDTNATEKIKEMVNEIYLDEVASFKPWFWLKKTKQIVHKAAYITGTAVVTQDSTTVTLSTAPTGQGSFNGYRFSTGDSAQIYYVDAHTANALVFTLTTAFQEVTNATATFKLWRDSIDLPIEAKETVQIWHKDARRPLNAVGTQTFRELEAMDPKCEGTPTDYSTWDFYDPSSSDDEFETDRYRQTKLYPSINNTNVLLNVDFIQEVNALVDDADEPVIPVEDRIVLFYGALAMAYSAIARDEDMHDRYWNKFQQKLARMAGERDEGQDTPKLTPVSRYVNSIRRSGLRR